METKWLCIMIMVIAICFTLYNITVDTKVIIMDKCVRGIPDSSKQIECAKVIYK